MKHVSILGLAFAAMAAPLAPPALAEGTDITPPTEVTPEIVAGRGCLEGVVHPTEEKLSFERQAVACDDYVRLLDGSAEARRIRAWHYYDHGTKDVHFKTAYDYFTDLIDKGEGKASDYFYRGQLQAIKFGYAEEGISDYDKAIELSKGAPSARYHLTRGYMLLETGEWEESAPMIKAAIVDFETVIALGKGDARVSDLLETAQDLLHRLDNPE